MTETARRHEPKSETLNLNEYLGLYGRLFLASQPSADVAKLIDPASNVDLPSKISISSDRNYSPITQKLSNDERVEAWRGVEFAEAYEKWRTGVVEAMQSITDTK